MFLRTGPLPVVRSSVLFNSQLASQTFMLAFEERALAEGVRPGHFLMVTLPTLRDPLLPRPFAVYNVEGSRIEILYKRVGKGTGLLSLVRSGQPLDILGPLGNGFRLPDPPELCLVLAGGIGIASVHLLVKQCLAEGIRTVLMYGVKSREEIVPLDELESRGLGVLIATEDGTLGFPGRATGLLQKFLQGEEGTPPSRRTTAFVCGPPAMLRQAAEILNVAGIEGQVSVEARMACGYGVCQGCVTRTLDRAHPEGWQYRKVCTEGPVFDLREIDWRTIE